MTDILSIIKESYPGKYDYLRLGLVRLTGNKVNVTFLIPEEIYDYRLTNEDIHNIREATVQALGKEYKPYCHFEKVILTEENVRSALAEYLAKYFPLIAANLDFSLVKMDFNSGLNITFTVQNNIRDYMLKIDFDQKIKVFFRTKYAVEVAVEFSVVEDSDLTYSPASSLSSGRYGKTVNVSDKVLVFGKMSDLHDPAIHISGLRGEGENVVCCGKISRLSFKTRDESKKGDYKRFFKHYYTFSISDTTGNLGVFINTDDECKSLVNGAEVVCKGRVNMREDMTPSMYVKSLALCKIPFDTIAEQTKPLDPPKEYSVLFPKEYTEVTYDQLGFDFMRETKENNRSTAQGVCVAIRSLRAERVSVPYEIAMCSIEQGKIKEYLHTFLKVAFSDDSEIADFANRMGYSSPRLATIIPDLIKFTADKLIIGVNPSNTLDLLNSIAKPLRYFFSNDVHVIQVSALKGEETKGGDALSEAVALANSYIRE